MQHIPDLLSLTFQTTCSNDISLLYPWLHITDTLLDIKTWLRKQGRRSQANIPTPPPPLLAGSLGRHGKLETAAVANMRIVQVENFVIISLSGDNKHQQN